MEQKCICIEGVLAPVPTPFDSDDRFLPSALRDNLASLAPFPLRGDVVLGSNGEFVLLSEKEKLQVVEHARACVPPDRLLIAGTGCESTAATIALARKVARLGADAALVITPSYYRGRMTSEALTRHFLAVADAAPIPIVLYNMPANTGVDLGPEAVLTVAGHPNVVGIKDSGGNLVAMAEVCRAAPPGFHVLAGSAGFFLAALSVGAAGGIMALANIAPAECCALWEKFRQGDMAAAKALQLRLVRLNTAVTRLWGVAALKRAMDMLGLYGGPVRAPLLPLSDEQAATLSTLLEESGVLAGWQMQRQQPHRNLRRSS
ncbi:MAG: dihydrodipicolinate synthase family protein [bacterium]|jgi:4-hydroxy-2-oxoglutarate aldolase|nr:dihydrodipicolinate synthase family protein [candidate division KSB1 bacterium]MDH7560823.1 dihydrodipicolinate synthase family protein [bacterium]